MEPAIPKCGGLYAVLHHVELGDRQAWGGGGYQLGVLQSHRHHPFCLVAVARTDYVLVPSRYIANPYRHVPL